MSEPQEGERVDARSLRLSAALGAGGQGRVYAVESHRVDDQFPAVYKRFTTPADPRALLRVVRFRRRLNPLDAQRLDEIAAWPAAVVHRDGRTTGFLMRRAPEMFLIGLGMPSGPTQHLAQVQLLLNDAHYRTARGLIVDDRFRLELLHDTASAIEFLHGHAVVVGDLSPANLLFTRSRRPRCFFLDCDAMRVQGMSVLPQAETIDWQTPDSGEQIATSATDSYKFALLCIRLFAGDQSASDPQVLDRAGPAVKILATRALSRDPRRRPAMAEWRAALSAAGPRGAPVTTGRQIRVLGVVLVLAAIILFWLLH
jgi:serine/threonine protein kinase